MDISHTPWIVVVSTFLMSLGFGEQIYIGVSDHTAKSSFHQGALLDVGEQDVFSALNTSVHVVLLTSYAQITDPFRQMFDLCRELHRGPVPAAALLAGGCWHQALVGSVLAWAGLPQVVWSPAGCASPPPERGLAIRDGRDEPSLVLTGIVHAMRWKRIIVFYDSLMASMADELISRLSRDWVVSSLWEVSRDGNVSLVREILREARLNPEYSVPHVVICDRNSTRAVLRLAAELDMRRREYRWVLASSSPWDSSNLTDLLLAFDNIVVLDRGNQVYMQLQGDARQKMVTQSLVKSLIDVSGTVKWQPPKSSTTGCKAQMSDSLRQKILQGINLPQEPHFNFTFPEYKVLSSVARGKSAPKFELVGVWSSNGTLDMSSAFYPNSLNGFNNRTFIVTSLEYSFFQRKVPTGNGTFRWEGLTFQLLDELALDLNFSYVVVEPPDGMWGIQDMDGNWNGMISMVVNKSVDFAAAGFSVTGPRETVIDFAQSYFHDQSAVLLRRPASDSRLLLYLRPFKWEVWASCSASVVVCGAVLWAFTRLSPYYSSPRGPGAHALIQEGHRAHCFLDNALLYIFGAILQQGGSWLPYSQSGRILVGCFWFFTIVIVATYTGNLIAFLAVNTVQLPFSTLYSLVHQDAFEWGTAEGVALVMLFRDATFEPYASVYKGMVTVPDYTTGLKRVKQGNYAFIAEKSYYQAEVAKDCDLAIIKEVFYPTNYAWAFQQGAPFVGLFNDRINKMRESGLLDYWIKKWTPRALNCTGLTPVTRAKVADLVDFQGALYVLAIGSVIATVVLLVERVSHFVTDRFSIRSGLLQAGLLPHHTSLHHNSVLPQQPGAAPEAGAAGEGPGDGAPDDDTAVFQRTGSGGRVSVSPAHNNIYSLPSRDIATSDAHVGNGAVAALEEISDMSSL